MITIQIKAKENLGPVKPVHGIDNGPVCFGGLIDSSRFFQQAGFPFIRLHDTNYPHAREVDIPQIFSDFSRDPDDPGAYDFRRTDTYLRQCLDTGAQIIYRLGVSIEHQTIKYTVDPPADFQKWARICRGIVRHYNQGWADGHHWDIRYWEIWNEPDLLHADRRQDPMWSGTPEQYFDLYAVTSRLLKADDPRLKIGGYAACGIRGHQADFFTAFLDRVENDNLPLDFFSWHIYSQDPAEVCACADIVAQGLKKIGREQAEIILDEWNYIPAVSQIWQDLFAPDGSAARARYYQVCRSHVGAAFAASVLLALQDSPVTLATFYDGQPTNLFGTLFDCCGVPQKPYYAFLMFRQLYETGYRAAVSFSARPPGFYACAAANGADQVCLMLTACGQNSESCQIRLPDLDPRALYQLEKFLLDQQHDAERVDLSRGFPEKLALDIKLEPDTVLLLKLTRLAGS